METKAPEKNFWASKRRQEAAVSFVLYIIALLGAAIFVVPLIWMVSTSLKTPTDIFTIPPKWVPISKVYWNYNTKIEPRASVKVKISEGEDGSTVIDIIQNKVIVKSHVVPVSGTLQVRKNDIVDKGQLLAKMPEQGKVKIFEEMDGSKMVKILDNEGRLIDEKPLPRDINLAVSDGSVIKVGAKLATIPPQWRNYVDAWFPQALKPESFTRFLTNTIIITVLGILGVILSSSFVAYGFARFSFPGKNVMFLIMISTMMIPAQVTMIPTFVLFKYMGWIDTFYPLIVPAFFGGGAFNIFLMRQFFLTIPIELDEAARIDGCNYFQIFWIILLPLVKPALVTIAIFGFVYNWNDFMNPLIYLNSASNYTLALGLQTFTTMYGSYYHLMMAASTIVLLPILIMFFFGQRYFIEGVATSGLKG